MKSPANHSKYNKHSPRSNDNHDKSSTKHIEGSRSSSRSPETKRKCGEMRGRGEKNLEMKTWVGRSPESITHDDDVFVWKKKYAQDGKKYSEKELREKAEQCRRENNQEIEELRRKRMKREKEREARENDLRKKKNDECFFSSKEEEKFALKQARLRLMTRLQNGNPCPIDYLARLIFWDQRDFEELDITTFQDPMGVLKNLNIDQLEDVIEDVKICKLIDNNENPVYWNDIDVVAKHFLKKNTTNEENINDVVQKNIISTFSDKNLKQLLEMEKQLTKKVQDKNCTNPDFWYTVIGRLNYSIAKLRLKDIYTSIMKKQVEKIKKIQENELCKDEDAEINMSEVLSNLTFAEVHQLNEKIPFDITELIGEDKDKVNRLWKVLNRKQTLFAAIKLYELYNFQPCVVNELSVIPNIPVIEENKFYDEIKSKQKVQSSINENNMSNNEDFEVKDEDFDDEIDLGNKAISWTDKSVQAKKPKYTNIVRTGYDWNRYNRTHFTFEDPPPKIVQGYRFTIMYDELLDPTKTPQFTVVPDPNDEEFATITFKAGPPYMDIAFKIVNREWQVLHKKGFEAKFSKGIFRLSFFFKKYRYRR
ncbi:Cactin [Strongyloides ratti]|uniref:Splicing factor Cactin n=1 Tax=Strongyloides ratti TaxID=34506 RepID=A0A090LL72_STRRB|nr:Cactin [Strongyloides ratti]CEF68275.1 Cactin [Strongyloides ratti]